MFTGFSEETTGFFLDIRFHNNIAYCNENKERYERHVRDPFYAMITELAPCMQEIDPEMEIRPYRCLARLRRDVRFSRDKSPYKDHLWFNFRRAAEQREGSLGFWFGLGPDWTGWGLGVWGENKPVTERFRREIAADPARVGGIITGCSLASRHLSLIEHPAHRLTVPEQVPQHLAPWYMTKSIDIQQMHPELREAWSRDVFDHVLSDFQALAPIYRMLRGVQDEVIAETAGSEEPAPKKVIRPADEW